MFKLGAQTYLNNLNKFINLGRKPKDVIAVAESREMAEEIKQNVIDQLDFYDHNGILIDSKSSKYPFTYTNNNMFYYHLLRYNLICPKRKNMSIFDNINYWNMY